MTTDIEKTLAIAKAMYPRARIVNDVEVIREDEFGFDYTFRPLTNPEQSQMVQAHFRVTVEIAEASWLPQISSCIYQEDAEFSSLYVADVTLTPEAIRRAIFESAYLKVSAK